MEDHEVLTLHFGNKPSLESAKEQRKKYFSSELLELNIKEKKLAASIHEENSITKQHIVAEEI